MAPVLLTHDDDERRAVHAGGRDGADPGAKPGRRMQEDERRPAAADREPGSEPDHGSLVQPEDEADVVRQVGEERDLRRTGVREHRRQPAPAEDVERRVSNGSQAPQTSSATSTTRRSLAACSLDRELVALERRGEAALRREAELVDVDVTRCLFDPSLQLVLRLELAALRGHEPEHGDLSLRQEAERLEAAGALVVPLEEVPIDFELVEEGLGDEVVAAGRRPTTSGSSRGRDAS